MFQKNAIIYTLKNSIDLAALAEGVEARPARDPEPSQLNALGWVAPFGEGLVESIFDGMLVVLALRLSYRDLSASVVRDAVKEKVDEIESREQRKVFKKERDQIKDEAIATLLPRAFIKHKTTYCYIYKDLVIVDASTAAKAEDVLSAIRDALGSFPVVPATTKIAPSAVMVEMIRDQAEPFELGKNAVLTSVGDEVAAIRLTNCDLESSDVEAHLCAGMSPSSLELNHDDMKFTVSDKLHLKKIRFGDAVHDYVAEQGEGDKHAELQAGALVSTDRIYKAAHALFEKFGGLVVGEQL